MGNKLGRRRQVVDEKYTKPQGLYLHKDVDIKKLRKLILESKLAPCYPGDDECAYCDLEECPICFLYYPSLNRSRCCLKGICTECFLQMKTPNSTRPTQCPFCKTSNYAVEYRGVKTKEEKSLEQVEEQRVIEAKIRIHQQEMHDEEEKMQKRQGISSSTSTVPFSMYPVDGDEIVSSQDSCPASVTRRAQQPRQNREQEFDVDLEDIMVMEAIWLSIQDNGKRRNPFGDVAPPVQYVTEDRYVSPAMVPLAGTSSSASPSAGLACAIAALAERQQMGGESSTNYNENASASNMLPASSRFYSMANQDSDCYPLGQSSIGMLSDCRTAASRDDEEWNGDHGSEGAEAGTSYASSDGNEDAGGISRLPPQDQIEGSFRTRILPETFEEQMMLAMAVSLADDQAMTTGPGVSWQ